MKAMNDRYLRVVRDSQRNKTRESSRPESSYVLRAIVSVDKRSRVQPSDPFKSFSTLSSLDFPSSSPRKKQFRDIQNSRILGSFRNSARILKIEPIPLGWATEPRETSWLVDWFSRVCERVSGSAASRISWTTLRGTFLTRSSSLRELVGTWDLFIARSMVRESIFFSIHLGYISYFETFLKIHWHYIVIVWM